jgi:formylglycine-generating enzyme required for sulfatase activity
MGSPEAEQDRVGNEGPEHLVMMSGFWLSRHELTKAQWTALMGTAPWSGLEYVLNHPDSAAVYISWNDAQAYVSALRTYSGLSFRLPSESEWEYACRAGTTTRFYWGDDPSYTVIGAYAWWQGNTTGPTDAFAHVTGLKLPNAFGLYDMSGNVWEWCEDDWHASYSGAPTNGSAWVDSPRGSFRVKRGGGIGDVSSCRSAHRGGVSPLDAVCKVGFRVAR